MFVMRAVALSTDDFVHPVDVHLVFNEVISRIKKSKYYSASVDSTPDEGHVDQLALIFRYLEGYTPVERFVTFFPNQDHKGKEMFNSVIHFLKDNDMDIKDCLGQSYNKASSMSGKYNGLRSLVMAENNQQYGSLALVFR